jgi:hypothetical protein
MGLRGVLEGVGLIGSRLMWQWRRFPATKTTLFCLRFLTISSEFSHEITGAVGSSLRAELVLALADLANFGCRSS